MKKIFFLAIILFACFGCKNNPTKPSVQLKSLSMLSCDSILHLVVNSCDIDSSLKNKLVMADRIFNDTMLIKIYHENEAEKDAFVEAADGWICISLKRNKIFMEDIPNEKNYEINCDTALLSYFTRHCLKNYDDIKDKD